MVLLHLITCNEELIVKNSGDNQTMYKHLSVKVGLVYPGERRGSLLYYPEAEVRQSVGGGSRVNATPPDH